VFQIVVALVVGAAIPSGLFIGGGQHMPITYPSKSLRQAIG
jgi:hypothetical protein